MKVLLCFERRTNIDTTHYLISMGCAWLEELGWMVYGEGVFDSVKGA